MAKPRRSTKPADLLAPAREKPLAVKHLVLNPGALSHEKIVYEPTKAFPPEILACKNLESLDLFRGIDYEGDPTIPAGIGALKKLRVLTLGGLTTTKLPDAIGDLAALEELSLDFGESLNALPKTIGKLKKLRKLALTYTSELTKLPKEIGGCKALRELTLANSGVTAIPAELFDCRALETLGLPEGVTRLPKGIAKLTRLRSLSISPEALRSIARELPKLASLEELWIPVRDDDAPVVALPEEIASLPRLRVLAASYSRVTVPTSLAGHATLETLEVAGNGLTSLAPLVASLPRLETLELAGNALSSTEKRLLDRMMSVPPKKRAALLSSDAAPSTKKKKVAPGDVKPVALGDVASVNSLLFLMLGDADLLASWKGTDDPAYEKVSDVLCDRPSTKVPLGTDAALGLSLDMGQGVARIFRAGESVVFVEGFIEDEKDPGFLEYVTAPPTKKAKKVGALAIASGVLASLPNHAAGSKLAKVVAKVRTRAPTEKGLAWGERNVGLALALPPGSYTVSLEPEVERSWGSAARAIVTPS